jgi:restriction system protein
LNKYYETLDSEKVTALFALVLENDVFNKGDQQDIELFLKQKKQEALYNISDYTKRIENGDNAVFSIDILMSLKEDSQLDLNILNDLEYLLKLFNKKDLDTDYKEIRDIIINIDNEEVNSQQKEIIEKEFIRISSALKGNITIPTVLKEYIENSEYSLLEFYHNMSIEDRSFFTAIKNENKPVDGSTLGVNIKLIEMLLQKFNLKWSKTKLNSLIIKACKDAIQEIETKKEEIELEEFEKYLDSGKIKKDSVLPDYALLNGLEFESYMKQLFEIQGYVVFPTKSTGDQGADLILMKDHEKTAVQIKKYSGKVSNKAVQEVVASKNFYNCENAIVVTNSKFTDSAIQLAKVNKVELWDSIKLKRVINKINGVPEQ